MDLVVAEKLQVGDKVRHRGEEWTILARLDRGNGRPHFRLQRGDDDAPITEGLTSYMYLDSAVGGTKTSA